MVPSPWGLHRGIALVKHLISTSFMTENYIPVSYAQDELVDRVSTYRLLSFPFVLTRTFPVCQEQMIHIAFRPSVISLNACHPVLPLPPGPRFLRRETVRSYEHPIEVVEYCDTAPLHMEL